MKTLTKHSHAAVQQLLAKLQSSQGLGACCDALFTLAFELDYLKKNQLSSNKYYAWFDPTYNLTFKTQINIARSRYTPDMDHEVKTACPICIDNLKIKPALRIYEFTLRAQDFFLQVTPFPLFANHLVLIAKQHRPMMMNCDSIADMLAFVDLAPDYVICSNSDIAWAGASILAHHHYQVFRQLDLPIMHATVKDNGFLHYPAHVKRIISDDKDFILNEAASIITQWKQQAPNKNTFNLVLRKSKQVYELHLIFRNSDYRTAKNLQAIKSEGVGVIELSGVGIYPEPTNESIAKRIDNDGLEIIKALIQSNSCSLG